jgi:hypothetical protein
MFKNASKSVSTLTFVVHPDPYYSGPSATLVEAYENTENTERDLACPEAAALGDIQMEYSD